MTLTDNRGGIVRWRREQLRRAGFSEPCADRLAADARMDLHALIGLVERGCPPSTAERILRPLDPPDGGR